MNSNVRRLVRVGVVGLVTAGAVALGGAPASAHVTVTPTTTAAGAYSVLTVSVPHGCEGSATTKVAIKIPNEIVSVTPTLNSGWTVEKVLADLNPPIKDSHGNEVTKRVAEVVYTARTPLPDGYRDAFELSLKLPDTPGKKLIFPSVQTCEKGETAWVQVPAEGQKSDELKTPAPGFTVTDAKVDTPAASAVPAAAKANTATGEESDGGSGTVVSWIALGVAVLGLVLGGFALMRSRKTTE